MGCNAFNHPTGCNCGWGGETGSTFTPLSAGRTREWDVWNKLTPSTYTIPNANCPVCGARVFYYRSDFDSRVFFDALGPPWPKHFCTDRGPATRSKRISILLHSSPPIQSSIHRWKPLIALDIQQKGRFNALMVDDNGLPARVVFIRSGLLVNAPIYRRRSERGPLFVRLSGLTKGPKNEIDIAEVVLPAWFQSVDDHVRAHRPDPARLTGRELNSVGWSLSFAFRNGDPWWVEQGGVNLRLARTYFEEAVALGFWPAKNNLAVMLRDGLGGAADPVGAVKLFLEILDEAHPTPLRSLAGMVERGSGCVKDTSCAARLRTLATDNQHKSHVRARLA